MLIIATGGQGEPRAALGRIAFGKHELKLAEGDTVIFSSKQIPGNEIAIGRIMNALSELGALTVTERQAHVHVSGHPGGPSLRRCTAGCGRRSSCRCMARPATCANRRGSALAQGIPQAVVQENGDIIRLAPKGPKKIGNVRVGRLVLDGDVILPADGSTINERRKIAVNGLITVGAGGRRQWANLPAIRWFGRSAFRSSRIATISSPMPPMPRPVLMMPKLSEDKAARSGAARGAPLRDVVDGQEAGRSK